LFCPKIDDYHPGQLTVLAYLFIEVPAGIYPGAVFQLSSLRGTDTENTSVKVSRENTAHPALCSN
jgi:hypothetical protein